MQGSSKCGTRTTLWYAKPSVPIGKNTWSARGKRWQLVAYVPVKNYVAGTWQARGSLTMMNRYVAIRGNTWQCQRVTKQQYHAFMCNVDVFLFSESRQIQYVPEFTVNYTIINCNAVIRLRLWDGQTTA